MEKIQRKKAQLASIGSDKDNAAGGKLQLVAKMVLDPKVVSDYEIE